MLKFNFKKVVGIFLTTLLMCDYVLAQNQQIDNLNLNADRLYYKPDSMIIYAREAYKLSIEKKYKSGEALALKFLGTYEHYKSNFTEALNFYKKALNIFEENKNNFEIAKTTLSISIVYNAINDHVNSINYGLRSLKIFEDLNDTKGKGKILNVLGISCAKQGDFSKAKGYFLQYNALSRKGKDTIDIAFSYNNLGGVNRDLKLMDSALYYFKIAAKLLKKKNYVAGIALADKNIGSIYADRKDFKTALSYAKSSLKNSVLAGDKRNMCFVYQEIGTYYKELKDTANAYVFLSKAIDLAKKIDEKETIRDASKILSELDNDKADYRSAYENLLIAKSTNDSLINTEKTKVIQDLITRYETEKKEEQIKILNQQSTIQKLQLKQKNVVILVIISVLIFGAILAYLFYSRKQLKAKATLQQEINKQQDLAARAVLDAEERERRRIAGDLHDGVGQLLSASLMNLNGLFKKLNLSSDQALQAEQSLALVNESYDEMRSISHQMMPNALIKSGLASAIKEFLNKIDQDVIKVSLETVGLNQRLDEQEETVLYRIIQETVNNVIKHADATKLNIVLIKDDEGISATIEDNGKGFEKSSFKEGIGISNMQSRIEFLKGTLDVDTAIGKGTLVAVFIPN
jgi:two-component system NarL family sensor kinase